MPPTIVRQWSTPDYSVYYQESGVSAVYAGDLQLLVEGDEVGGMTTDGIYTIRYDFQSLNNTASQNPGAWVEWTYTRSENGDHRELDRQEKMTVGEPGPVHYNVTYAGGNDPNIIYFTPYMLVGTYTTSVLNTSGQDVLEQLVPGTWRLYRTVSGPGFSDPTPTQVVDFDIRMLAVRHMQTFPAKFDCRSEHPGTTVTADVYALPVGWVPDSPQVFLGFVDSAHNNTVSQAFDAGGPDSTGKIYSLSYFWNGKRSGEQNPQADHFVESVYAQAVTTRVGPYNSRIFTGSNTQQANVEIVCCACGNHPTGSLRVCVGLPLLLSPVVGPTMAQVLCYTSSWFDSAPESMGYGWKGNSTARMFEPAGQNGALSYRDESGNYARWVLQGGNYMPDTTDNYAKVVKQSDPNATYVVTFQDQSQRQFNSDGLLVKDIDRLGNALTYGYTSGQLTSMTDAAGQVTTISYDGRTDGQARFYSAGGRQTELQYDSSNRLCKIIDPAGESTGYVYNDDGRLWKIVDTRQQDATVYTYDSLGRLSTETSYGLQERLLFYGDDAVQQLQSPYGMVSNVSAGRLVNGVYEIYPCTCVAEIVRDLQTSGPDRVTGTYYNDLGMVVQQNVLVSAAGENGNESAVFNTTKMEYDFQNPYLLAKVTNPNLAVTYYNYNAQGNVTDIQDAEGNHSHYWWAEDVENPLNPNHRGLLMSYMPTTNTNSQVNLSYDAQGNLTSIQPPVGPATTFTVRSDGQVASVTDRRGKTTTFNYNSAGRISGIVTPADSAGATTRTTTMSYDDFGNLTQVTDPLGNSVTTTFDGNNRPLQITDARQKFVTMTYNQGRLTSMEAPANQGSGTVRRSTSFDYDDANRMTQVNAEIAHLSTQKRVGYNYNGFSQLQQLSRLQNSVAKATHYSYDRLGRMTKMTDFLNNATTVAYEPFCTQNTVTTARGVHRTSAYDVLCRLKHLEYPEDNVVKNFQYDTRGRLLTIETGDVFAYTDPETSQVEGGKFGSGRFGSKLNNFEYDDLNRVTSMQSEAGQAFFQYDQEGNVTSVDDRQGNATQYDYYDDGLLKTVTFQADYSDPTVFTYTYDLAGRLTNIAYPSGLNASFTKTDGSSGWNENGQLLSLRYLQGVSQILVHRFGYSYDDAGNRTQMIDTPGSGSATTWDYGYDWLNRLTSVSINGTQTTVYAYDESDNRVQLQMPQANQAWSYAYDLADRIQSRSLSQNGGPAAVMETYSHDLDGNMIARTPANGPAVQYTWNNENRLTELSLAATSTTSAVSNSYKYQPSGIRISRVQSDQDQATTYNTLSGTAWVDQRNEVLPVAFIRGHQLLGVQFRYNTLDPTTGYFITDGLGSVRKIVDSTGTTLGEFQYDEFGQSQAAPTDDKLLDHGYIGGLGVRTDWSQSGLLYMQQRYYDPQLGRFLNQDPIGFQGGLNLYGYVGQNPTTRVDANGLGGPLTAAELADFFSQSLSNIWAGARVAAPVASAPSEGFGLGGLAMAMGGEFIAPAAASGIAGLLLYRAITTPGGPSAGCPSQAPEIQNFMTGLPSGNSVMFPDRPLLPEDLDIKGNIEELTGTIGSNGGVFRVRVDMIQGRISNPMRIVEGLRSTAQDCGANELQIEGTLANTRLLNFLQSRYNAKTDGSVETIRIPLR